MIAFDRPSLMLVTDRRRLAPDARTRAEELRALDAQLDEAIESGVDIVQLRERDLDAGPLAAFARRLVARAGGTRIVVNDRADVALAAGAGGVHLRGDSVPAERVRSLRPDWLLGRSIHEGDDLTAAALGVDYLLFGMVFETASKPSADAAGLTGLARAAAASAIPVLAIGGITPERAAACAAAGAVGVAAIGLFLPAGRTPDAMGAGAAVAALRAAMRSGVSSRPD